MRVIALDPGETMGYAVWNGTAYASGEATGGLLHGTRTARALLLTKITDRLVLEDFEISASTVRKDKTGAYTTLHMIGGIKVAAADAGVPVTMQRPIHQEFGRANDWALLRAVGWFNSNGAGHCNSAGAHLLKYLTDARQLPAELLSRLADCELEL